MMQTRRREMLTKGLRVAAAAVGAGAVLDLRAGAAQASSTKSGVFASATAGTPAVKATGSNGADGLDASSDSGAGVSAKSGTGTGLVATSSSGLAGHFSGDVKMDNNLAVAGGTSTGTLSSGAGTFASTAQGTPAAAATGSNGANGVDASSDTGAGVHGTNSTGLGPAGLFDGDVRVNGSLRSGAGNFASDSDIVPGVTAIGTNGADGLDASSDSGFGVVGLSNTGTGVIGESDGGTGVFGSSNFGLAGDFSGAVRVIGNVQVIGTFSATGTKNFIQVHPSDPAREIVYVALEGGEAGTYVRGTGQLQDGKAVIALPVHFDLVTAEEGLTVQLTPRCEWLQLYAAELGTAQLVVREAQDKSGLFDYFVSGVRKGYEQHEVIRPSR